MVRPATPLSSLIFLAFALLIVSILSTPIIKGIKLGGFRGTDYGVFGFCEGAECSGIKVGYDPGMLDSPIDPRGAVVGKCTMVGVLENQVQSIPRHATPRILPMEESRC